MFYLQVLLILNPLVLPVWMFQGRRQILFFNLLALWCGWRLNYKTLQRSFCFLQFLFWSENYLTDLMFVCDCDNARKKSMTIWQIPVDYVLTRTFFPAAPLPLPRTATGLELAEGADEAVDSDSEGSSGEMSDSGWLPATEAVGAVVGREAFAFTGFAGRLGLAVSRLFITLSFDVPCRHDIQSQNTF